jgi:hypothetical protein
MLKIIFGIGTVFAVIGVVCYASTIGQAHSEAIISTGASFFSLGILLVAAGFYLQGRQLRSEHQIQTVSPKKTDRLCSSCNREAARIFCRVHLLRLCSNCIERHDDGKNCLYVPAKRAAAAYK